jgi:hypothetical protein
MQVTFILYEMSIYPVAKIYYNSLRKIYSNFSYFSMDIIKPHHVNYSFKGLNVMKINNENIKQYLNLNFINLFIITQFNIC